MVCFPLHFQLALLSYSVGIELTILLINGINYIYSGAASCRVVLCSIRDMAVDSGIFRPPQLTSRAMSALSISLMSDLPTLLEGETA